MTNDQEYNTQSPEALIDFLESRLKASIDKIDKMTEEDFYRLLAMRMESEYIFEDQRDELADTFGYKLKLTDEIKKNDFQKSITQEDIKEMLEDNLLNIYCAYAIGMGTIILTSPNPYETLKRMFIVLGIAYSGYFLNKKYFLSNFHKKASELTAEQFRKDLEEVEEKIKILEIYKKYTSEELNYATEKLLEIAPEREEEETFYDYLFRIFPDKREINAAELSFLDTKKKVRKR